MLTIRGVGYLLFIVGALVLAGAGSFASELRRISQTTAGTAGDGDSRIVGITPDGRSIVIASSATNLVPSVTLGAYPRIYVYDVPSGKLELISVQGDGTPSANHEIAFNSISADGRYVLFSARDSKRSNPFVPGDTNRAPDLFMRDRASRTTVLLSRPSGGGRANGGSGPGFITRDGKTVILHSEASNLASGMVRGGPNVLKLDLVTHHFKRIQLGNTAVKPNALIYPLSISGDGRYLLFSSTASNLVPGDKNGVSDFFLRDLVRGKTEILQYRPRWPSNGFQRYGGLLSADGRYMAFTANAPFGETDRCRYGGAYLYDRTKGSTTCVSVNAAGNGGTGVPQVWQMTSDARFILFSSTARDLVPGDTNSTPDVFVRDRQPPKSTQRVSVSDNGAEGSGYSRTGAMSDDGSIVAFASTTATLVSGTLPGPVGVSEAYVLLR